MPTGQKISNMWFIRVTVGHVPFKAVWQNPDRGGNVPWNFSDIVRCLVVGHVGEKTEKEHVHMVMELSKPLQKQTVDKRIKTLYGVSGADYSSKLWDGDMGAGAGSYMFHDPNATIIYNQGFTDEDIEQFKRLNAEVQKVVEVNKQRASGRCVERLLNHIIDSGRRWTKKEITVRLLKDIRDGVMYEPGDYVLKRYIEEIYEKQLTEDEWLKYMEYRVELLVRSDWQEIIHPM